MMLIYEQITPTFQKVVDNLLLLKHTYHTETFKRIIAVRNLNKTLDNLNKLTERLAYRNTAFGKPNKRI